MWHLMILQIRTSFFFYVHGSVHHKSMLKMSNEMQQYAVCFILLKNHSTCFGCLPHPSPGLHQTVTTAPGTSQVSVQLPRSNVATLERGSCTDILFVPEAVVTDWCTPGDGCGRLPKRVELFCSKIKQTAYCCISFDIINVDVPVFWRTFPPFSPEDTDSRVLRKIGSHFKKHRLMSRTRA